MFALTSQFYRKYTFGLFLIMQLITVMPIRA